MIILSATMELILNRLSMLRHPIDIYYLIRCIWLIFVENTIVPKLGAERVVIPQKTSGFEVLKLSAFSKWWLKTREIMTISPKRTSSSRQQTLLSLKRDYIEVIVYYLFDKIGAFPVKRNFPFLRHLGIRSILYSLLMDFLQIEYLFLRNIQKIVSSSWKSAIFNFLSIPLWVIRYSIEKLEDYGVGAIYWNSDWYGHRNDASYIR